MRHITRGLQRKLLLFNIFVGDVLPVGFGAIFRAVLILVGQVVRVSVVLQGHNPSIKSHVVVRRRFVVLLRSGVRLQNVVHM